MKKLLRNLLILVALLGFTGFFAFSTLVWNPFEGRVAELRAAVPRTVHFFAAKADLSADFEDFPRPWFWSAVEESPAYARIRTGSLFHTVLKERGGERMLAAIEDAKDRLASVPVLGLDLLDDFIGTEAAVAGRFRKQGPPAWCLYTRVGWKVRAAFGLLRFAAVRARVPGLAVAGGDGAIYELRQATGPAVFVTLVKDLLIAGDDLDLVRRSRALATGDSEEDALVASSDYQDFVVARLSEWSERNDLVPNALECELDLHALAEAWPGLARFAEPGPDDPMELRLLNRFVNVKAMYRAWGSFVFAPDGLAMLLSFVLDRRALSPEQVRFQTQMPGHKERWLKRAMLNVPSSAAVAAFLRIPPAAFFEQVFASLDEDTRSLINEGIASTGRQGGFRELVRGIAASLDPSVVVVVRDNDYGKLNVDFKVAVPSPAPAVAWIFEVDPRGEKRLDRLLDWFETNRTAFGFSVKTYYLKAGNRNLKLVKEFPNPQVPGTGEIAIVRNAKGLGGLFMVGNSGPLLAEIVNTRFGMAGTEPLTTNDLVEECLQNLPETVSGFAWLHGEGIRAVLSRYEEFGRRRLEQDAPDPGWMFEHRPAVEKEVFAQHFAGRAASPEALRGALRQEFERLVEDALVLKWRTEEVGARGRAFQRAFAEAASYLEFLDSGYLMLKNRAGDLNLEGRIFLRL